ncbi:MAG: glycosyl hydrolase-related protein, partial [Armatimonadota bacterium]
AIYSVPYGAVKRGQYEPDVTQMCATNGDWPAINWVDVADSDSKHGVALINTGTPSHIVKDGVILLSILRSPTDSWCLNEPEHYDCPDFDGARDAGRHEFDVSLIPHVGDFAAAEIEKRAREVNNPLQITLLGDSVDEGFGKTHSFMTWKATDNIVLSALKKAETEDALIARICETSGMDGQISVRFEGTQEQASKVNFLERLAEPAPSLIPISPWKIQTLRFDASEI